uniref:Uncharacterized protein n=1 Tax=Hyaloperonospora arabidopsidis (strain Emoy2) TaxID=559515 RepID=M4BP39_HYAAE
MNTVTFSSASSPVPAVALDLTSLSTFGEPLALALASGLTIYAVAEVAGKVPYVDGVGNEKDSYCHVKSTLDITKCTAANSNSTVIAVLTQSRPCAPWS